MWQRTHCTLDLNGLHCTQPEVVRNDPAVVHREVISSPNMKTIGLSPILRIATVVDLSFLHQWAWIILGAVP